MTDSPAPLAHASSAEPAVGPPATLTADETPGVAMVSGGGSDTKSEAPTTDDERKGPHYLPPPGVGDILTVAPMMECTDRHYRYMMRFITRCTRLYTEMLADDTILHCKGLDRYLQFDECERPLALQLGGSDPEGLATAVKKTLHWPYDEINLNCGCPSAKVSRHCFGARMMESPELVKECVQAMGTVSPVPVTVKCRLGVDHLDSYAPLTHFVRTAAAGGVTHFIIHARKAILGGLSTADNRRIPPLKYDWVLRLAHDFPELDFSLNGGISDLDVAAQLLSIPRGVQSMGEAVGQPLVLDDEYDPIIKDHGAKKPRDAKPPVVPDIPDAGPAQYGRGAIRSIMIGRHAYSQPWDFADVDRRFFGQPNPGYSRREIVAAYLDYADRQLADPTLRVSVRELIKPLSKLFGGSPGSGQYRNALEAELRPDATCRAVVAAALAHLSDAVLDERPPK